MGKPKKAIVSVTNDLYTDNRVDKICLYLVSRGYAVTLVGRKRKTSPELQPRIYKTKRFRLLWEKGPLFYASFNFRLFLYLVFKRADVLVANDLDTLLGNYAASKTKPNVKLVYDAHEYFTEVPELVNRPVVQKFWLGIEAWIFPKLKTIYTVNASIAALYAEKYKKKIHVVRNVSPRWKGENIPGKIELGIPEDQFLIILQGAGINIHRGAEEAVEAMLHLENAVLMILGDGDVVPALKHFVRENGIENKVLFFEKMPYAQMMYYTFHADIGLTLDKPNNINYRFSLPNKVFDYMHASTPIIGTRLIEIEQLIEKYNIGWLLDELTTENLANQIRQCMEDKSAFETKKTNCAHAAETENWEHECQTLNEIYSSIE